MGIFYFSYLSEITQKSAEFANDLVAGSYVTN